MMHGRPQKLSQEEASLKGPALPPQHREKNNMEIKGSPHGDIFYDFLGRGRAPTLAHPIAGVHSMLPPPPQKKTNNYGQGCSQDLRGGGNNFFSDLEICTSQSDMLRMAAMRFARGYAP